MPIVKLSWNAARSACIQFGGRYIISDSNLLEEALRELVLYTGSEDTFDLLATEVDPLTNEVIGTIARQEHGFPEELPEQLRAIFRE